MALFDDGCHGAADADAVATHDHGLRLAVGVQVCAAHGFGILRAKLEDVADFDAFEHLERLSCDGAGVAFADGGDVVDDDFRLVFRQNVTVEVEIEAVDVFLVGTDDEIGGFGGGVVHDDADLVRRLDAEDGREARNGACVFNQRVIGEFDFGGLSDLLEFRFVDFEIAADASEDERAVEMFVEYGFAGLFGLDSKELRQIVDGLAVRRFDLLKRFGIFLNVVQTGGGDFAIGFVFAVGGDEDGVFAAVRDGHEFMGDGATDHAGV